MHVSYIEIYNESVNDLLNPANKNLDVKACDSTNEVVIDGLTRKEVKSVGEVL
jgi:hypothetical protein